MDNDNRGFGRAAQVGQQIHRIVARLFVTEVNDPRLEGVEIVDVDLTPDLRNAHIYYMMLDGEPPSSEVQKALNGTTKFVQSKLAERLAVKYIPGIQFRFDKSILEGRRIDELLEDLDSEEDA